MSRMRRLLLGALLLLTTGRRINFFSLKQDVEIGAESSQEAERSLQLIKTLNVNQYVNALGQRILQNRALPVLKYRLQIVNSKDVNSLGFPGGSIYLYRGLVDLAPTMMSLRPLSPMKSVTSHRVMARSNCRGSCLSRSRSRLRRACPFRKCGRNRSQSSAFRWVSMLLF